MKRSSAPLLTVALGLLCGCGGSEFTSSGVGGAGATSSSSGTASSSSTSSSSSGMASSSSSGMTSSSSSGMASSSSSSSGMPGGENCTNGKDDNGDGFIDCADPLCTAYECVAPPPMGWFGPIEIATTAKGGNVPSCESGYALWKAGPTGTLSNPPATCTACTCGDPNSTCGAPTFTLDALGSCGGSSKNETPSDASCQNLGGVTVLATSIQASAVPVKVGICPPDGGGAVIPEGGFSDVANACVASATGKGCGLPSHVCTPSPTAGFGNKLCVVMPGDVACPGVPFIKKTVFYETEDDNRGCSACLCDAPLKGACTGKADFFDAPGCNAGGAIEVQADGMCHGLGQQFFLQSYKYTPGGSGPGGTCTPTAGSGAPTGTVQGHNPNTVCCQ